MAVGVFLRLAVIKEGIDRFSEALSDRLGMPVVSCKKEEGNYHLMGHTVTTSHGLCHVTIPYEKNEYEEYGAVDNKWTVEYLDTGVKETGFRTLGEVEEYIKGLE